MKWRNELEYMDQLATEFCDKCLSLPEDQQLEASIRAAVILLEFSGYMAAKKTGLPRRLNFFFLAAELEKFLSPGGLNCSAHDEGEVVAFPLKN